MSRDAQEIAGAGDAAERVVWDPRKSLWFGGITLLAAALAGPFFLPGAALFGAVATALTLAVGHSVGIHRLLIHRSFTVPRVLERALVYVGVLVGLGGPLGLLRMHEERDHWQNQPRCHDYYGHRRWFLVDYFWVLHCRLIGGPRWPRPHRPDVTSDPFYRFLERTWRWQQLPWAVLLLALGGWPYLVWGGLVRVAVSTAGHWMVGHFAHRGGYRWHENRGAAVQGWNSLLLGPISMGEGWHNNHHAFPRSARLGIRAWEIDFGWWFIAALRRVGLATHVLLPGPQTRAAAAVLVPAEQKMLPGPKTAGRVPLERAS